MSDTAPPRDPWFRLGLLACALVPLLVFWGTVSADFVQWDDDINIYRNPNLESASLETVTWALTDVDYVRRYMPLGWLSWMVNIAIDGRTPSGFHLGNILLHAANCTLVYLIVHLFLAHGLGGRNSDRRWVVVTAAFAALFWALHPLRVEPVAWASGRLYEQAAFLLLLSLFAYLKAVRFGSGSIASGWGVLSVVAYAASLLTYPLGLGWFCVFLLLDLYPLKRLGNGVRDWWKPEVRRVWLEKIPYILAAVAVLGVTLWARVNSSGQWRPPPTLEEFGVFSRIMQAFYILGCYLWKLVWPVNLSPLYTELVTFNPMALKFWGSLILVGGCTLAVWRFRQRATILAVLWLGYLLVLFPMLGWTDHPHYPSDRYSYLSGLFLSVAVALGVYHLGRRPEWQPRLALLLTLVVGGLAVMSQRQASHWQNSETLFHRMLATLGDDPLRYDIYDRLGHYYMNIGEYAASEASFLKELELKPGLPRALFSLGNTKALQGELDAAIARYEEVRTVAPDFPRIHLNLGFACAELGRFEQAATHLEAAVAADPDDAMARDKLQAVRLRLERKEALP